jgi:hypothetical protein
LVKVIRVALQEGGEMPEDTHVYYLPLTMWCSMLLRTARKKCPQIVSSNLQNYELNKPIFFTKFFSLRYFVIVTQN